MRARGLKVKRKAAMKPFSGKLALAVAGAALLTTATYAQTPSNTVQSGDQGAVSNQAHPRATMSHHSAAVQHHAHPGYDRHAYHTGTAYHAATIYNQAAGYGAPHAANEAGGFVSEPLYNAGVLPAADESGVACLGGRGPGYYPNPSAYDESAASIISGGEFTLDRGYPGCFAYFGE
jgi:hypothetical protein